MRIATASLMAVLLLLQCALAQARTIGAWRATDARDPFTDQRTAMAVTFDAFDSALVVRCKNATLDAIYKTGAFLNHDTVIPYRYRIDRQTVVHQRGNPSRQGDAVFLENPRELSRALARGEKFVIEAEDYRGVGYTATFSLNGSAAAIKPVLRLCHRDPDDANKQRKAEKPKPSLPNALRHEEEEAVVKYYVMAIRDKVQNSWIRPHSASIDPDCLVDVIQSKQGEVLSVTLQNSCGSPALDQSVENAVRRASPLPAAPSADIFEHEILFHFTLGR